MRRDNRVGQHKSVCKGAKFNRTQQKYIDTSSSPDINYLRVDTDEYVKISSRDRPQSPLEMDKKYSIIIRIGAATVVPGTIIAAGVGYFVPGAITGIALAITVTLWWV